MLGPKEIKEIIPHRYPFLLLDRVEEIVDGVSAKGFKNVSINEPFFQGHYPDYPVMPGVLILEAMAQLGAVAVLSKEENKGKIPLFAGTNKVRWKKQVVPGDKLDLYVEIIKLKGPIGVGKGISTVDGVKACEAELLFAIG
ncbi:3-hydroxyacyl-ACP dehydratase FabZ [Clostridium chauvoei]|uniref:3-hydroxyacyl-[acyl-carrier-protein] dehydratase n=2 Tax=Clostridium chauvoei TaxID=46867 RepID=S6FLM6_9CLOT|nr:3-hydroxyacyl-ACP dehydratase FabZ [Clostridium chauvoei]ATD54863.1 3-hydroxyacyl-[acyl-carrier-protein] dehydratase FabZ [Clostridium chauvoei]ATD57458.1 3-hydroxyacyl-[acyl-carrier-protein] dehydratase FabZ [Clostridium chauvoei]MBX7280525.1 3-hydroxyacyl-ACP dehydratase FabZ [Clostridium chauvoei]MBX7283010.1 3-hydroxyacyl-ACP dehydratase FabZ [Clostridium chauvoei]MBX7285527.1 3-hydroxyacyl-ACP dehydratase FabZ [Clostridium chauvoei]